MLKKVYKLVVINCAPTPNHYPPKIMAHPPIKLLPLFTSRKIILTNLSFIIYFYFHKEKEICFCSIIFFFQELFCGCGWVHGVYNNQFFNIIIY